MYQNNGLSFNDLLEWGNSVTIHQRNPQIHVTEIFKLSKDLALDITKEVFGILEPFYNFLSVANHFKRDNIRTSKYCIQLVRYLDPKLWDLVPNL